MAKYKEKLNEDLNTFFVDTKSTCFLCLEELPSSSKQLSGSHGGDAHFEFDITGELEQKRSEDSFCLRKIFRFLKLNPGDVFGGVHEDLPFSEFAAQMIGDDVTDFSVILCEECLDVAGKLNTLCEHLETLQRKIHIALETFHGKLFNKTGSNQTPLVEMDHSGDELTVTSPLGIELVHAVVTDILRTKTKEKCFWSLKNLIPQLKLGKSFSNEDISSAEAFIKVEQPSISLLSVDADPDGSESEIPMSKTSQPSPEPSPELISFKLPTVTEVPQQRDDNNLVTCNLCPASAHSTYSKDILFQRHVICCHLDFFFASLKLPNLSMEEFKAYCEYILEEELKLSEQFEANTKKNTDDHPGFICNTCGDIFHEVKVTLVHMVLEHHTTLAKKLDQLQRSEDISPEQLLSRKRSEIFEIEGQKFKCENCGRVFVALSSLNRHKKAPCKQRSTEEVETRAVNRPFVCQTCGLRFTTENGRKLHTRRIHQGINHNRNRMTCDLCGKSMSRSSISRHKIHSCPVTLGKAIKGKPASPSKNFKIPDDDEDIDMVIDIPPIRIENNSNDRRKQQFPYYLNENVQVELVESEEEEEEEEEEIVSSPVYGFYNQGHVLKVSQRPFPKVIIGSSSSVSDNYVYDVAQMGYSNGPYYDDEETTVIKMESMHGEAPVSFI